MLPYQYVLDFNFQCIIYEEIIMELSLFKFFMIFKYESNLNRDNKYFNAHAS